MMIKFNIELQSGKFSKIFIYNLIEKIIQYIIELRADNNNNEKL